MSNLCNPVAYGKIVRETGFHGEASLNPSAISNGLLMNCLKDCDKAPIVAPYVYNQHKGILVNESKCKLITSEIILTKSFSPEKYSKIVRGSDNLLASNKESSTSRYSESV